MILYSSTDGTRLSLTLKETKQHLRIATAYTAEDDVLTAYIKTANAYAENYIGKSITQHTWVYKLPGFPGSTGHIELPMCYPLSTKADAFVIKYLLDDTVTTGTTYTLSASYYVVSTFSDPVKVYPSYNNEWPSSVRSDPYEGNVIITYKSGYASVSSCVVDTPADIKSWMKLRVADMYEHRQEIVEGHIVQEIPRKYVDGLLDRYKVGRL